MVHLLHEAVTGKIIEAAVDVHRALGPGLLESTYEACLAHELSERHVAFKRQVALPVVYKGVQIECGYRIDMIVERSVIVEIKSIEATASIHEAQLMTYLRLSGLRVGLLVNFNHARLTDGITRRVL